MGENKGCLATGSTKRTCCDGQCVAVGVARALLEHRDEPDSTLDTNLKLSACTRAARNGNVVVDTVNSIRQSDGPVLVL